MGEQFVYGIHAVQALLQQAPQTIKQLWMQKGRNDRAFKRLLESAQQLPLAVQLVPSKTLNTLIKENHQGVVALCVIASANVKEGDLITLLQNSKKSPLLLILDGVTDPHNLGACLRSADAAGATAVIAPKDKAVGITAVVRKVACGAAENVPFIQVTNLARTLQQLQQQGIWLYGADTSASSTIYDVNLSGAVAIVMGAEEKGLRRLTREHCDYLMRIPMQGSVASLNVSVATGICLFESIRQRQGIQLPSTNRERHSGR